MFSLKHKMPDSAQSLRPDNQAHLCILWLLPAYLAAAIKQMVERVQFYCKIAHDERSEKRTNAAALLQGVE
jgi:hypothetical protein